MRPLVAFLIFAATLLAQGGGSVQFRDWNPTPSTAKPVITCRQLLGLTSFELSVIVSFRQGRVASCQAPRFKSSSP
jgi:hypothetical protein